MVTETLLKVLIKHEAESCSVTAVLKYKSTFPPGLNDSFILIHNELYVRLINESMLLPEFLLEGI